MVRATITYKNGEKDIMNARDFYELFKALEDVEIKEIDARIISVHDIRQGRK